MINTAENKKKLEERIVEKIKQGAEPVEMKEVLNKTRAPMAFMIEFSGDIKRYEIITPVTSEYLGDWHMMPNSTDDMFAIRLFGESIGIVKVKDLRVTFEYYDDDLRKFVDEKHLKSDKIIPIYER